MPATGLTKATKEPASLSGSIYLGTVKRVDVDVKRAWVTIPRLAGQKSFGPLAIMGPLPNEGHRVACTFMENGELIVLGVIQQVVGSEPVTGGMIVSAEPPVPTQEGQQWFDLNTANVFVALDSGGGMLVWVQIDGSGGGSNRGLTSVVNAGESTASTTLTNLATVGPSVDITMDEPGWVHIRYGSLFRTVGPGAAVMMFELHGATNETGFGLVRISATTGGAIPFLQVSAPSGDVARFQEAMAYLDAGTTTIICKYAAGSGTTAHFTDRFLTVTKQV